MVSVWFSAWESETPKKLQDKSEWSQYDLSDMKSIMQKVTYNLCKFVKSLWIFTSSGL